MKATLETMSVEKLLQLRSHQMLSVNAEYQRGAVWSSAQKKRLIDSVLRGYQIPLFYLHYIKRAVAGLQNETLEIIDGQQRILSLYEYREGAFKLFDPAKDEREARFPAFIKDEPCPWAGLAFDSLSRDLQKQFLDAELSIVKIETDNPNEARDLFIRLQAGMPLNAQEKRDAWPGNFTEFILKIGGKPDIARYPGHDFFTVVMKAKRGGHRGKTRQLAAQMVMLYLTRRRTKGERLCDINAKAIDDFYYQNLDFDQSSTEAHRFVEMLDKLTALLRDQKRPKIVGHEAIHMVLLIDSLWDDYTRSWESRFAVALDLFRVQLVKAKLTRYAATPDVYWLRYGIGTRVNSDRAETILLRHQFFSQELFKTLGPQLKDPNRLYGSIERQIIYYRDKKACAVCGAEVIWEEAEIHHLDAHGEGGRTTIENGVLVHGHCHPKGSAAARFAEEWRRKQVEQEADNE